MNDRRGERAQRRDTDDRLTARCGEVGRHAPRGRFREEEGEDDDHAPSGPRGRVRGAGLAVVIAGWVGLALSLALAGFGAASPSLTPPPPLAASAVWVIMGVLSAAANVVVIIGGHRMRRCRGRGLALAATVLCTASPLLLGPCGVFGVGSGIWALVVLLDADVRREFESVARPGGHGSKGR